ncbi:MAG: formimidoylglutamate deiminase [Gemmatimonadales bacterium]|nr:MAG: formimidoylglutamate deiminase [Gemmatimonadales bacterium]
MTSVQIVEAELTWTGDSFEPEVQVEILTDGRVGRVGSLGLKPTLVLPHQAVMPGFVNAHSHAFQRGLRGQGERFPSGAGSFWTWREAMYGLVDRLDRERFTDLATQAFMEMRASGITTVGEFHYLHHSPDTEDFALDRALLTAAEAAGIRLVLLVAYYRTGGINTPVSQVQQRFFTPSPTAYWEHLDGLVDDLGPNQTLGVVVHSIRAGGPGDISTLHAGAIDRGLPFHMHVEEQRREIEASISTYGRTPMRVILDAIGDASSFTAVHCTHTDDADRSALLAAGGRICLCPLTEANLGDGIPMLDGVDPARCCLGTDSNARIDMFEEMRWLEYGQRLRGESRGALADADGHVARTLLDAATSGGAAALAVDAGRIATGALADMTVVSLDDPTLDGATPDRLLEAMVCGTDARIVTRTAVGGSWITHRTLPNRGAV